MKFLNSIPQVETRNSHGNELPRISWNEALAELFCGIIPWKLSWNSFSRIMSKNRGN